VSVYQKRCLQSTVDEGRKAQRFFEGLCEEVAVGLGRKVRWMPQL
jgi:hypothetical protein